MWGGGGVAEPRWKKLSVFVFMFLGSKILINVLVAAWACLQGIVFGLFFVETDAQVQYQTYVLLWCVCFSSDLRHVQVWLW